MLTGLFTLFQHTFPQVALFAYLSEVRKALSDCRTCLDIGCCGNSPMRFLNFEYSVGVDGHEPSLAGARQNHTHSEYRLMRVQEMGKSFARKQFDCCVASDLIEHLTKEEGRQLIRDMERIASKKVLLFTPNGFLAQSSRGDDLQQHLSGWEAGEMRSLGFTVAGMHGHRFLRGEQHRHRFRPRILSGLLSVLTHYLYTRSHPEHAAALLCIKDVTNKQEKS